MQRWPRILMPGTSSCTIAKATPPNARAATWYCKPRKVASRRLFPTDCFQGCCAKPCSNAARSTRGRLSCSAYSSRSRETSSGSSTACAAGGRSDSTRTCSWLNVKPSLPALTTEIGWTLPLHPLSSQRMQQAQEPRMQQQARSHLLVNGTSIKRIARNRVSDGVEVHPELV